MTLPSFDMGVYGKLAGDAGVAAIVGTRIYEAQAPAGTTMPYVIFYLGSGTPISETPLATHNVVYRVEGRATTRAGAEALMAAIYEALHLKKITIAGWNNYWLACERINHFVETVAGVQTWRRVGDFRIKVDQ